MLWEFCRRDKRIHFVLLTDEAPKNILKTLSAVASRDLATNLSTIVLVTKSRHDSTEMGLEVLTTHHRGEALQLAQQRFTKVVLCRRRARPSRDVEDTRKYSEARHRPSMKECAMARRRTVGQLSPLGLNFRLRSSSQGMI